VLSVYFILFTITTIGFGDVAPQTSVERLYVILIMIVGVTFFTVLTGALASIMTTYDI